MLLLSGPGHLNDRQLWRRAFHGGESSVENRWAHGRLGLWVLHEEPDMKLGKQPLEPAVKYCPDCKSRQAHENGVEEVAIAGSRSSMRRAYFVCQKCGSESNTTRWRQRERVVALPLPNVGVEAPIGAAVPPP